MSVMDVLTVVSLTVGIASIAFSFFVWNASKNFEVRVHQTLSEIDKNSSLIKETVTENQKALLSTLTDLALKAAKQNDPEEKVKIDAMSSFFNNPKFMDQMMPSLMDHIKKQNK